MTTIATKERPIIFSGEMVRAILDERKTQTRRVMKPQAHKSYSLQRVHNGVAYWKLTGPQPLVPDISNPGKRTRALFVPYCTSRCPYGEVGDRLWVREKQVVTEIEHGRDATDEGYCMIRVGYVADGAQSEWLNYPDRLNGEPVVGRCLSYGGYRESSRILLEITDVRGQHIQDIDDEDILAEGVSHPHYPDQSVGGKFGLRQCVFPELWDSFNAKRGYSYKSNPWVWPITFKKVDDEGGGAC